MTDMLSGFFVSTFLVFGYAQAIPISVVAIVAGRDVVDPPITSPDANTVWCVGDTYTVKWDNSGLPALQNITNVKGDVLLGSFNQATKEDNINISYPLAQNFLITDQQVSVKCPDVTDGQYFIVLMGDSGNQSPLFSIYHGLSSSPVAQAPSSALSSSSFVGSRPYIVTLSSTPGSSPSGVTSRGLCLRPASMSMFPIVSLAVGVVVLSTSVF